jgi:hypothetical protein
MLWNKKPGRKPSDADKPNDLRMALITLALWTDGTPDGSDLGRAIFGPAGAPGVGVAVALRMIENADRAMLAEALTQAPEGVGPAALIGLARLCRILENAATKAATD